MNVSISIEEQRDKTQENKCERRKRQPEGRVGSWHEITTNAEQRRDERKLKEGGQPSRSKKPGPPNIKQPRTPARPNRNNAQTRTENENPRQRTRLAKDGGVQKKRRKEGEEKKEGEGKMEGAGKRDGKEGQAERTEGGCISQELLLETPDPPQQTHISAPTRRRAPSPNYFQHRKSHPPRNGHHERTTNTEYSPKSNPSQNSKRQRTQTHLQIEHIQLRRQKHRKQHHDADIMPKARRSFPFEVCPVGGAIRW